MVFVYVRFLFWQRYLKIILFLLHLEECQKVVFLQLHSLTSRRARCQRQYTLTFVMKCDFVYAKQFLQVWLVFHTGRYN